MRRPAIAITSTSKHVKVMVIRGMRRRKTGGYIRGLFPRESSQDSGRVERSQGVENPWYDKTAVTPQDHRSAVLDAFRYPSRTSPNLKVGSRVVVCVRFMEWK